MTKAGDEDRRTRHIDVPLGARLRVLREERGLTQADMGRKLNISTNQWGRHESGANRVPATRLWQFCQAMNIDVAELYQGLPVAMAVPVDTLGTPARGQGAKARVVDPEPSRDLADNLSSGSLVQRIGAAARELSPARQRTALAVIRALKLEQDS